MRSDRIERALGEVREKVDEILTDPDAMRAIHTDPAVLMSLALVLGSADLFERLSRMGQLAQDEESTLMQIATISLQLDDALTTLQLDTMPNRGAA
jgi:hypothetical protein